MLVSRVVVGWLMLSLEGIENREKERIDMMEIDNGMGFDPNLLNNSQNVEGAIVTISRK